MIFIRQSYDEDPNEFQLSDTDLQSGPPDLHKCPSWRIIMKFLLRKQTKETKTRQKRFFAFVLSVLICCLPTATVLAANIDFHAAGGEGTTIYSGEKLYGSNAALHILYKTPQGDVQRETHLVSGALADGYVVEPINGYNAWRYIGTTGDCPYHTTLEAIYEPTPPAQPVKEEKSEDTSKRKHYDQTPTSWEANPNEISAFYIKNGFIDNKAKFGKEEQGETCQFIFRSSFPAGNNYKEAFSLSMSYDGKHTTDLKDGTLLLYIPPNLQRSGRKFKMLAINKDGEVYLFDNTSDNEGIFQTKLNVEGYAFCLIYTDEFILN